MELLGRDKDPGRRIERPEGFHQGDREAVRHGQMSDAQRER